MGHKVHHTDAVDKFFVIPGNGLNKVEGNASPSLKNRRVVVTVKVRGDTLVLSVAQMPFREPANGYFTTFLLS